MNKYARSVTPILRPAEILERMCYAVKPKAALNFKAFYSSELGGIITEPAFMMIHMDDHMVHRGHSVFDLSRIEKGNLYLFDRHLERFLISARLSNISIGNTLERIRKIILETCSASMVRDGEVRFWLSAGRGGFSLNPYECETSSFYVQVIERKIDVPKFHEGWRIKSSKIPAKSGPIGKICSTNFLSNAMSLMEAEASGSQQGVFLDENGYVAGSSNLNFMLYTGDKRLLVPCFDNCLAGCTVTRVIELVNWFLNNDTYKNREDYEWLYENIKSAEFVPLMRPREMRDLARELFLVGSDIIIAPIFCWDDEWLGKQFLYGHSELFQVLYTLIKRDMTYPGYESSMLTPI